MRLKIISIKGCTQIERESFTNHLAKKHHLTDRPHTLGPIAKIYTYRNTKAVKNIIAKIKRKGSRLPFSITLTIE